MFSEQLAVLLFIAATQVAGHGGHAQPTAQLPPHGVEKTSLQARADRRQIRIAKPRLLIKKEREAMMLAEFR
jgi:hypothetical protein